AVDRIHREIVDRFFAGHRHRSQEKKCPDPFAHACFPRDHFLSTRFFGRGQTAGTPPSGPPRRPEDSALSGLVGWYTLRRIVLSLALSTLERASRLCLATAGEANLGRFTCLTARTGARYPARQLTTRGRHECSSQLSWVRPGRLLRPLRHIGRWLPSISPSWPCTSSSYSASDSIFRAKNELRKIIFWRAATLAGSLWALRCLSRTSPPNTS